MLRTLINKNIRYKIIMLCLISIIAFALTGCGNSSDTINIDTTLVEINNETSELGINLKNKDAKLSTGEFYVLHEGIYYPAYAYFSNYDFDNEVGTTVAEEKQIYCLTQNEYNIPTLYLAAGDKLIYYDETSVVDYIIWERYKDLGYTLGLYGLQPTKSGRYYIDIEDNKSIIAGAGLDGILNDVAETNELLVDKIGNTRITENIVKDGLIEGTIRNQLYSLDIYNGTQYHHYNAEANVHAFSQFELFASIEYDTLREYTYEIEVPDYLVDGYYKLNMKGVNSTAYTGFIRIIKEDTNFKLNDYDRFNKQLLYIYTPKDIIDINNGIKVNKDKKIFSEYKPINEYKTDVIGSLGYDSGEVDIVSEEKKKVTLSTATIRKFNINLPTNNDCLIELKPKKIEPAGEIYIYIGDKKEIFTYDSINNTYFLDIKGDGNTYTLFVSGIWNSYDIVLTDCKQDTKGASKSILPNQINNTPSTNSVEKETVEPSTSANTSMILENSTKAVTIAK